LICIRASTNAHQQKQTNTTPKASKSSLHTAT
jgi:hypothetical protein